jgi:hypothetical protein
MVIPTAPLELTELNQFESEQGVQCAPASIYTNGPLD